MITVEMLNKLALQLDKAPKPDTIFVGEGAYRSIRLGALGLLRMYNQRMKWFRRAANRRARKAK